MPKYETYESFREWLSDELAQRKWSHADLARHGNVTRSHISRILTGERPPGPKVLVAIAHALHLPEEVVLRRAGLLAVRRDVAEGEDQLTAYYRTMTPANRKRLLHIAHAFAEEPADE